MSRVKNSVAAKARHKKILAYAKGYYGRSKNCYRIALQRVEKAWQYAYRDRRVRKRDFRRLWTQRINAAVRQQGLIYSNFIYGLKKLELELNRKTLSEIAIYQPVLFEQIVTRVKKALKTTDVQES